VLTCAALVASSVPLTTTFNVTAHTERFAFRADGTSMSRLPLNGARMVEGDGTQGPPISGTIELGDSTSVQVERTSTGPLVVRLAARPPAASVGELYDEHDLQVRALGTDVTLVVDSLPERAAQGVDLVFPFAGLADLGGEVRFGTGMGAPLLRDGTVTMMGTTLVRDRRFDAGSAQLATGDRLRIDHPHSTAQGFIVADEQPGMTVVLQVRASHARVDRVGREGFELSTSWLEALAAEPALRPVWGAIVVIFTLAFSGYEWRKEHDAQTG
jgi:hypothetical protein